MAVVESRDLNGAASKVAIGPPVIKTLWSSKSWKVANCIFAFLILQGYFI